MAPSRLQVSACFYPAVQEAVQDPADGPEGLIGRRSGGTAAMLTGAPAQPQAGVASAPAAASGRGLSRTVSPASLTSAAAGSAEPQQPAPLTLRSPATPGAQSRSPGSHRASRYGPSQVVPCSSEEEEQHPDGSRPLLAIQQRQQSAQPSPSLAKSVFSRVAVIGNMRLMAEQQQRAAGSAAGQEEQQSARPVPSLARSVFARVAVTGNRRLLPEQQQGPAGSAAGQEELEAAPLGASACVVPSQPQLEDPERSESPTEAGMAAATGSEGGDGPGSATLMPRGSR